MAQSKKTAYSNGEMFLTSKLVYLIKVASLSCYCQQLASLVSMTSHSKFSINFDEVEYLSLSIKLKRYLSSLSNKPIVKRLTGTVLSQFRVTLTLITWW